MEYTIKIRKKVSAEEFASELTKQILDRLEKLEDMLPDNLKEVDNAISEISEYIENVQDQIAAIKKANKKEAEKQRQHEKGLKQGVCVG